MYFLYLLNVVVLLSFSNIVSSSPVAQGTTSHCNARDIAIVKRTANEPTYFCTWWNSDTRTRTPFIELTVSQVNNACKCISKSSKNKRAATIDHSVLSKGQSVESCSVEMSKQFTEPWHFCKFYTAYPRTTSPFRKYSAKSLLALYLYNKDDYQGELHQVIKQQEAHFVIKQKGLFFYTHNTEQQVLFEASKLEQVFHNKGIGLDSSVSSTSSSTTKSSSSTSSATATKTPTIRTDGQFYLRVENSAALPNDYYITTDDGYSLGPADPVLFAIGSNGFLYEVASSDKYWIGTTFDSVGRGYIGGYSELGQYHTTNLRCAYDGDYLLSCATASVNGTLFPVTFSYLGLGSGYYEWFSNSKPNDLPTMDLYVELVAPSTSFSTSSSSSTISSTTSFTTSTIATSTALSNATSSYIASTSSFNTSSIASPTAFSNTTSSHIAPTNTTTSLYIASTSSFNTSSIASPTAFSNTTSSHIAPTNTTSSYIAPSNVTSSLAISSTVSSLASSTASSNTSSYASANASVTALPTVAPTCTLIPRVANGGFEDGKNQTAWSTIGGSYGSWAPTTTNPYDGALSGQFTFQISDGGSVQASTSSVTLRTTLSNLCPGFQYSISYNSFCAALSPERCFIALWTTETTEWGESFSSSRTGSGWLTGSNYLEFAAASSTSTLYVYVGTMAHNNGVGTIYLDDVSIALSESKDIVQEKVIV
ncbi:hypothetical protein KCU95_g10574, partial [Aureobasidium melanogenum]